MTYKKAKQIILDDIPTHKIQEGIALNMAIDAIEKVEKIEGIITEHDEGYLHEFDAMNLIRATINKFN